MVEAMDAVGEGELAWLRRDGIGEGELSWLRHGA